MARAATEASGTPVALDTKGTVRDARGLTSNTNTSSPRMANWAFINPMTPSSSAIKRIWWRNSSCMSWLSEYGGMEQAESPE